MSAPAIHIADAVTAFAAARNLTVSQSGAGRPVLALHGGAGPGSVAGLAQALSQDHHVIAPVHPGFDGTPQGNDQRSARDLAGLYIDLLTASGATDALVIGSSMGGWIAAEMAALSPPAIARYVLIDAAGLSVPNHPLLEVFNVPPAELPKYSFHNQDIARALFARQTPAQQAFALGNRAALQVYSGDHNMQDTSLAGRLANIAAPVLVAWGESDRVTTPDYGRAYAAAIPGARFELIREAGHLPQIEQPAALLALIAGFEREA